MKYKPFLTTCSVCGNTTSKKYATLHEGKCKTCSEGKGNPEMLCPDCGEHYLTPYQKRHHYHCEWCTRQTDPEGWANEVRGFNDGPDY